jgi:hypothetical protein
MMQVVKIVTLLLFLAAGYSCAAQKEISGTFSDSDPTLAANDTPVIYKFHDSTFTKTRYRHLGKKTKFYGDYTITADTLILDYNPKADPLPSKYKFISKKPFGQSNIYSTSQDKTVLDVNFQVSNLKGEPINEPTLFLKNKSQEIIMAFLADSNGKYPSLNIRDNYIDHFQFQSIRYKPLTIPADSLKGYKSDVQIMLSDSQVYYGDCDKINKYVFKRRSREKIELHNLQTEEKLVLIREDPDNK